MAGAASARRSRGAWVAGAVAGLVAGGAMAAFLVLAALVAGEPPLTAFRAIGGVVPGVGSASPAAVVAGVLAHAVVSAAIGIAFAAVLPRDFSPACAAGVGVGAALLAMGFSAWVLLPGSFIRDIHELGGIWVIAHGVYGAILGLALQPPTRAPAGDTTGIQRPGA